MLSFFRNNVQSLFVKAIVSLVAVVMLFFGIDSYKDQGVNVLATVGSKEIKLEHYQRAMEGATAQIRKTYGPNADRLMEMMNIKLQVLQRLVNDALILESAKSIGLALTDKELAESMRGFTQFQTDGRYDSVKYHELLKQVGQSSTSFEATFRDNLLASKYMALLGQGHLVSQQYAELIYLRDETKFNIETLTVSADDLKVNAPATEEDIKAYYEKNSAQFQAPAQVGIDFFTVGINEVSGSSKISDKAIALYYKKHKTKEFTKKPSYHAWHILLKVPGTATPAQKSAVRAKAEALYAQLSSNPADFAKVAKQQSQDPGSAAKGGDLSWVEEGQFVPVFDRVVKGLQAEQISRPFLSQFGYHIAKLIAKKPAGTLSLEEAQPRIVAQLTAQKAERRLKNLHRKATQTLVDQSFEAFADTSNKDIKKSGLFDAQSSVPALPNARSLYKTLQNKSVGEKGALLEGSFVVVYKVTDSKAPETRPLESVRIQVQLLAQSQKEKEMTASRLEHMAKEIKTSVAFDQLAKGMNQTPAPKHLTYKDRQVPGLNAGRELPVALNRMKPGEVRFLTNQGQGYAVRLIQKTTPPLAGNPVGLEQLKSSLSRQKAQILISGLVEELRKTTEVVYNQQLLENLGVNLGG